MGNRSAPVPQQPVPGNWYTNEVGQLIYVRAVLFVAGRISRIAFEHTNGRRVFMDWSAWAGLAVVLHSRRMESRTRVRDL